MNNVPLRLQIELIFLILCFTFFIYQYVHKQKISVRYSVVWFISAFVMFICAIIPEPLEQIAKSLGIETLSNLLFLGGIIVLLVISFSLTIIVSELKHKLMVLTQEFGILKQELEREKKDERQN